MNLSRNIIDISNDSRCVEQDFLYVAIKGEQYDGHRFVEEAIAKGACCVFVEQDMGIDCQVVVPDTKQAYAMACANFFAHPAREMALIAVTGTNGKTSTTSMMQTILEHAQCKTGLIGTIAVTYGDIVQQTPHTTPDAYLFQKTLRDMAEAGCQYVVLEASSQALQQERLYGTTFELCVFTNLSPDHLDYHASMEDYFEAKCKLFTMGKRYLVNQHDLYGKRLQQRIGAECFTFALEDSVGQTQAVTQADFYAFDIDCSVGGVSFRMKHKEIISKVCFAIPGRYSVENALAAIATCTILGIAMETIVQALQSVKSIRGRCEILYQNDALTVIGDYAHSPDGIKNILQTLRAIAPGRLVAVFGCGGDRDQIKRPLMAQACEAYADLTIVTSDNPRSEDPQAIIDDILTGFAPDTSYLVYKDRTEAIGYAMQQAKKHDLIVLLGKGHETYQVLKDGKIHYDEREIVAQFAAQL